jgi:nicotinamide-nucleotide amidase
MLIQYLSIGSEVLNGSTLNTNSAFISKELSLAGFELHRHLVIGDEKETIKKVLKESIDHYDLTIVTGGLGPTCDDLTKNLAGEVFHLKLAFDQEVYDELKKKYPDNRHLHQQAFQLEGVELINNPIGTAQGFIYSSNKKKIAFFPGVPKEFETMVIQEFIPWLKTHYFNTQLNKKNYLVLLKRELEVDPILRSLEEECPNLKIGIYPSYGYLNLQLASSDVDDIKKACDRLENNLKTFLIEDFDTPALAFHSELKKQKISLSVAESCSGGLLSHKITSIPEASLFFFGGVIAYSNEIKKSVLKVDESILKKEGAVSLACVKAMASGVKKLFDSQWSLAVTGIAGPSSGSKEKPVGTVFLAMQTENESFVGKLPLFPISKRELIIQYATNYLLGLALRYLKFKIIPFA